MAEQEKTTEQPEKMQTIAQQLQIKKFPFQIIVDGKTIYSELASGHFTKYIYDENGNLVREESSNGSWVNYYFDREGRSLGCDDSEGYFERIEYDNKGRIVFEENKYVSQRTRYDAHGFPFYMELSDGYWLKTIYNCEGTLLYSEDSKGVIVDNRPESKIEKMLNIITEKIGCKIID